MPTRGSFNAIRDLILAQIDEAYDRRSWHGTNLKGSLRGVDAATAAWAPGTGRKTIAQHVLHAAYWKYVVRRRLTGEQRGSFPLRGSNWPPVPVPFDARAWRACQTLLQRQHDELRAAVASLSPAELLGGRAASATTPAKLVRGIILHDIYHTGQIQLIKRLVRS